MTVDTSLHTGGVLDEKIERNNNPEGFTLRWFIAPEPNLNLISPEIDLGHTKW
jgi:hypothetical protein